MNRLLLLLSLTLLFLAGLKRDWLLNAAELTLTGPQTVAQRLQQYGPTVDSRLQSDFARAGVDYPPAQLTLVILKQESEVQVYATNASGSWRYIRSYPILATSGHLGPKLQQGDEQVPEGIYSVDSLNPNSHYHLALHVNYPNAFDRAQAKADGRTDLGGDIMIHGSNVSIGCVAMGDPTAEDLFILTAKTGLKNVRLLFCPYDFRTKKLAVLKNPEWSEKLYSELEVALKALPSPSPQP